MAINIGIVTLEQNPFATKSWIEQKYGISDDRLTKLGLLFGKTAEEILSDDRNKCKFPAFVGIRWGFAEMKGGRLAATTKWEKREQYDKFGL